MSKKSIYAFPTIMGIVAVLLSVFAVSKAHADVTVNTTPPVVTTSTPSTSVFGIQSSVLDTQDKLVLEWLSTTPAQVKGCKPVKSFAKRGRLTCITLPVGTPFTNSGRDRNGVIHTFPDKVKKGDQTFYRGKDGKWRKKSCKNLTPPGKAELPAAKVILVKSFKDATYDVKVNLTVANIISAQASCQTEGASASASLSGSGSFTGSITIRVRTKYSSTAKTLATQRLSQSFKDEVYGKATAWAVIDLQGKATAMCSQKPPVVLPPPPPPPPPPTPIPLVDIVAGPAHFYVNGNGYIYAMVQAAPGHTATVEFQASDGNVSNKVPSDMYDGTPCSSGWVCYRARYDAPNYPVDQGNTVLLVGVATQDDGQIGYGTTTFEIKKDDFGTPPA